MVMMLEFEYKSGAKSVQRVVWTWNDKSRWGDVGLYVLMAGCGCVLGGQRYYRCRVHSTVVRSRAIEAGQC
jgi:hypothetical protein